MEQKTPKNSTMYEVEMKFPVENPKVFEKQLLLLGVSLETEVEEQDQFYQHPSRDFVQTDEGLRIRRRMFSNGNQENFMTYKGPKLDQETKTRREIEMPLDRPESWDEILKALSFQPKGTVQKFRRRGRLEYEGRRFEILLDRLPGLVGTPIGENFVELETIADSDAVDAARTALLALARTFGLSEAIRTSYLGLLGNIKEP